MKQSQEKRVIARIREVGYVDNFWAMGAYINRLGAIICTLAKKGWKFKRGFGTGINHRNFFYRLEEEPQNPSQMDKFDYAGN